MAQAPMTEKDLTVVQSFEEKMAKPNALLQTFPDEGHDMDEFKRTSSPSRHKRRAKPQSEIPSPCLGANCRQRVYRWAWRLVGNRDDAEDLCQEICLRCLLGRAKFCGKAKFSSWLYRVMVNTFKDFLRKKCEEEWIEPEMDGEALWEAWEAKSWERTTTKEAQEKVQRALAKLTERQQQLLMVLAEVIKTVVGEIKRRTAVDQLASQVAKHLSALQQRVEKCKNGKKFTCEGYQDRVDCGWFDRRIVFTCIGGDFSCEQPSLFDCEPSVRFRCYVY